MTTLWPSEYKKLTFEIDEVCGKGRPKFTTRGGYAKAYTPQKTKDYENKIKRLYRKSHQYCSHKAIKVKVYIIITPNKSARKNEKMAQFQNVILPNKKPDIDNVIKVILDALNGIAYKDDTQINDLIVRRRFGEVPKVIVTIEEIGEIELGG